MYKSKLQEVCHRNKLGPSTYSCIKDGPDHDPQFRASVSVNGVSFDSPTVSKSSKHALDQAAKLAFLHFTTTSASDVKPNADEGELKLDVKPNAEGEPDIEEMSSHFHSNASDVKQGIQYPYKMHLQSFAQRKNLDSPLYCSRREGPPHALQFQATVTIDGQSFESPRYFRSLKESEHAAAKVALMSLSQEAFQEIDASSSKNLLQEFTQNEGFTLPFYKTLKCGPPHKPTFFSSVEVGGEIFHGKGGKSKKLAELSAAKVAYTVFMERESAKSGDVNSCGSSLKETIKSSCSSESSDLLANVDPQESSEPVCSLDSSPATEFQEEVKDNEEQEVISGEDLPVGADVKVQDIIESPAALISNPEPDSFESDSSSKEVQLLSAKMTTKTDHRSYLLCNRFRIYTSIPDIALPKGTVLLPIDDCKWVVVNLEFSNQKY